MEAQATSSRVMFVMDLHLSSICGRAPAIQDEDYDLDYPAECDDEYWENPDPDLAFKQPPGKPSNLAGWIAYVKLGRLVSKALRTMYVINKPKKPLGLGDTQWQQRIVAELDKALNKWVDDLPGHLKWDPTQENEIWFNQSVALYTVYYQAQFLIHRSFIPTVKKPSTLSFPSLAICTNAARSTIHVVDRQRKRGGWLSPLSHVHVFNAGIVLLLNIWSGRRSGLSSDPDKEMSDVHKCMSVLRKAETRWHLPGRMWDMLYELASVGELPLPKPSPTGTYKRGRDSDSPLSHPSSEASPASGVRNIAGPKRALSASTPGSAAGSSPASSSVPPQLFSLPVHSEDLGRLPVHGQLKYASPADANRAQGTGTSHQPEEGGGYWFTETANHRPTADMGVGESFTEGLSINNYPPLNLANANLFSELASMAWYKDEPVTQPFYGGGHGGQSNSGMAARGVPPYAAQHEHPRQRGGGGHSGPPW
ncbi:Gypsy retrotransposon integrase-like protein 1 [Marasmius crinis-equi]|uniref:Gypsy retrotransposon integrase-like protein 1 n=1 Tax=Marasmius crinis-equi TaxID=585013 RepID=A0ABR3EPF3_9AGAR